VATGQFGEFTVSIDEEKFKALYSKIASPQTVAPSIFFSREAEIAEKLGWLEEKAGILKILALYTWEKGENRIDIFPENWGAIADLDDMEILRGEMQFAVAHELSHVLYINGSLGGKKGFIHNFIVRHWNFLDATTYFWLLIPTLLLYSFLPESKWSVSAVLLLSFSLTYFLSFPLLRIIFLGVLAATREEMTDTEANSLLVAYPFEFADMITGSRNNSAQPLT